MGDSTAVSKCQEPRGQLTPRNIFAVMQCRRAMSVDYVAAKG
jgi:hypothetical protein